jgi:hypothetical protein
MAHPRLGVGCRAKTPELGWAPVSEHTQVVIAAMAGWRTIKDIGGEFDPGSGSTLAACLMHASRTWPLRGCAWRTGEEHVGNLPWGGG